MQAWELEMLTWSASTLHALAEQKWSLTQSVSEAQLVLHAVVEHVNPPAQLQALQVTPLPM